MRLLPYFTRNHEYTMLDQMRLWEQLKPELVREMMSV